MAISTVLVNVTKTFYSSPNWNCKTTFCLTWIFHVILDLEFVCICDLNVFVAALLCVCRRANGGFFFNA